MYTRIVYAERVSCFGRFCKFRTHQTEDSTKCGEVRYDDTPKAGQSEITGLRLKVSDEPAEVYVTEE